MKYILLLCAALPLFCFSQTVRYRQYKPDEKFRYKLSSEVYRNDKFAGIAVSVSQHTVVKEKGIFSEEIKWISKTAFNPTDTINKDSIARAVKPYKVSLSPKGKVLLPKLTIPEMVGDITDLNTFYVAVAPALQAQKLSAKNKFFTNPEVRKGNFADSMVIMFGMDCMVVTQELVSSNTNYTVIRSSFAPPETTCLTPLLDTISKKIFDHPNNIQMTIRSTGDNINLFWGVEHFTITSTINNTNGQIESATMTNVLNLRMRYNSSPDLKTYATELPITIKRVLKLELLK